MDLSSIIKDTKVFFEAESKDDVLHIAFAVDENYMMPAGVMISSIIKNNPTGHFYFHIFTTSIKKDDVVRLKKLENAHCSLCIHFFEENVFSKLQTSEYFPISIYYRLVIPFSLQSITDRVLYLDSDMLCIGDIYSLKDIEFNNNIIAAIPDEWISLEYIEELNLKKYTLYFNSGFIYYNIPKWLSEDILVLFMKLINNKYYSYPDQDVLNIILQGKVEFLPRYYNKFFKKNEKNIDKSTILLHYVGPSKPWHSIDRAENLYKEYYDNSPWGDIPLRMPKDHIEYKRYSKIQFKNKHISSGIYWKVRYLFSKA
ncbi:glycosyltransferase family 8 protein, partial [Proteus myxofaciens]|uniref:glycosyltransferase family 8 protein n=1 Tax=Proteus myxofaciens TaxID=184072 RepID=UPI0008322B0A